MHQLRSAVRVASLVLVVFVAAGCDPWLNLPSDGGGVHSAAACPTGTWAITSETLTQPLTTFIPGLTITASGPGVTLTMNTDNTWTLHADQTLTAAFDLGSATVHVTGDANGTYTAAATTTTYTVASVTGSVAYDINTFGFTYSGTMTLPNSGLSNLYAAVGTGEVHVHLESLVARLPLIQDARPSQDQALARPTRNPDPHFANAARRHTRRNDASKSTALGASISEGCPGRRSRQSPGKSFVISSTSHCPGSREIASP